MQDNTHALINELSEGNVGAMNVMVAMDLDYPAGIEMLQLSGLRGSDIWDAYKQLCDQDLDRFYRHIIEGTEEECSASVDDRFQDGWQRVKNNRYRGWYKYQGLPSFQDSSEEWWYLPNWWQRLVLRFPSPEKVEEDRFWVKAENMLECANKAVKHIDDFWERYSRDT